LDAYCRILMLAKDLGRVTYLTKQETKELLDLKAKWGYTDPRLEKGMENCDICANDVFRSSWNATGVDRKAFDAPSPMGASPAAAAPAGIDQEQLVKIVTETVCKQLGISAA
ncbi:MAG: class II aldolase/adducin family protein, partial [Planctomycetia bacterium]|nr:class II aldolase/adducin family protein [Planctomycetia bacterium]